MADTKNEQTKETSNTTGELNWSGSQQGHGVKVEVKEKKQSDSTAETANSASQETSTGVTDSSGTIQTESASIDTTEEATEGENSKRQAVSFIVGLIIGALLTSILI